MRNVNLFVYGLDVEIRPKWTSKMDPPSCLSTLGGAIGMKYLHRQPEKEIVMFAEAASIAEGAGGIALG